MVVSIEMWPNFEWKMRSSDNEIDFCDVDVVVISGHGKVDFNDGLLSDRTLKEATGLDDCIGNVIIPLLVRDRSICCFSRFM